MRAAVGLGLGLGLACASAASAQVAPLDDPTLPARVPAAQPPRGAPLTLLVGPAISPVRVALICEDSGRTKVCPAFLQGFIDDSKVMRFVPRADADVVIYVAATQVALEDRVHLRFVSELAETPHVLELTVPVDSRGTDDQQRAQLAPAFSRGMAVFVGARFPSAVAVTFTAPTNMTDRAISRGSPWGVGLEIGGNGDYTKNYRDASGELELVGRYVDRKFRALTLESVSGGVHRQPSLTLDDGTRVSLDRQSWALRAGAEAVYLLDSTWSVGVGSYTSFEDPKAQYKYNSRARAAIEYDLFPSDDPRGNHLAVFYHLGAAIERYNIRNEIGETFAAYPLHGINARASVRHDKVSYGLNLESDVQLLEPWRRYSLTANPFITVQLGDHVDFNVAFSITKREFPVPDPNAIDPSDYEQLDRLSYAEPLSITGSFAISIHWDPTNGTRNDRLSSI